MSFAAILVETIPVFIIIGIGCLCRVTKLVTESSEKTILGLVLNLLYPCFILSKICGNSALKELSTVGGGLAVGCVTTLIGLAVAYFAARLFRIKAGPTRNTFTLSTAIQNYGFIPIPLIAGIFPKDIADETLGVLFIYILGLELVFWTLGVSIVSGSRKGALRRLVNGPSIAIVVGLILNFTQAYQWIPLPAEKAMEQLGLCSVPVSLLLVGVSLAGVMLQGKLAFLLADPDSCVAGSFRSDADTLPRRSRLTFVFKTLDVGLDCGSLDARGDFSDRDCQTL